jgi:hypothetical protein
MSAPVSKADKIENPKKAFSHPADVARDPDLSRKEKAKALDQLEQDERQLITADNEGMAPEKPEAAEEPQLDKVVKAKEKIGAPVKHKPAH